MGRGRGTSIAASGHHGTSRRTDWRPIRTGSAVLFSIAALSLTVNLASAQAKDGRHVEQKKPVGPQPADIDRNGVLILTRGALLALDQANKTGNYTVLRDLGAPGFQQNSAARLGEIFATQRQQQLDFAAIAVLEPQLTLLPQIEPSGMLHMAGFFPSVPLQVNFELLFAPVDGQWKIFGVSVNVAKSGPAAPTSPKQEIETTKAGPPPKGPTVSVAPKNKLPGKSQ